MSLFSGSVRHGQDAPSVRGKRRHQQSLDVGFRMPLALGCTQIRRPVVARAVTGRRDTRWIRSDHCTWLTLKHTSRRPFSAPTPPKLEFFHGREPKDPAINSGQERFLLGELRPVPDVPARPPDVRAHGSLIRLRCYMASKPRERFLGGEGLRLRCGILPQPIPDCARLASVHVLRVAHPADLNPQSAGKSGPIAPATTCGIPPRAGDILEAALSGLGCPGT